MSSWRATWMEIKQVAWAVALCWSIIGVLGLLTRDCFRPHTITIMIGLAVFVTGGFALIVAASLVASLAVDLVRWRRRSQRRGTDR